MARSDAEAVAGDGSTAPIPESRLSGEPIVVMLDVDGTLAPIALHPSLAKVPPATRRAVAALAACDGVRVALVSGRAAHDARRMVAVENVWTIGNHGAEVMSPDGEVTVDPQVARHGDAMAQAVHALTPLLRPLANVLLENKGWTLSVHYRMADEMIVPRLRAAVGGVVERLGLRMTEGKMVLEVRPPVNVDKGTAVYELARELGGLASDASLVFIGDDRTDEDAFRILRARAPHAVTVRVGTEATEGAGEGERKVVGLATAAEFVVRDTEAVRQLLERLVERRRGRR